MPDQERKARNARGPRALSCYDWQKIMVFCWRKGCKFLPWGFVRRPTRNYGDLRSQSRPTVDRVKRISFHLVIKFTFFVVLDTCQSIKRKLSWGRYWGWGNSLLVYFASDWLMPGAYYPTPITPNNLTAGKKGYITFNFTVYTTQQEYWRFRIMSTQSNLRAAGREICTR